MASTNTANLIIKGTDGTKKAFSSVDKNLKRTQIKTKALSLGMTKLTSGLGGVTRGLGGLGGAAGLAGLAVLGLTAAIGKAISNAVSYGDEIGKTSKKLNIGAEDLQLYRRALKFSGVESSTFEKALEFLGRSIGESTLGVGRAQIAFQELGISMDDLAGMSTIEQYELINARLSDVDDTTRRAALGNKIYSSSYQEVNKTLGENAEEFQEVLKAERKNAVFLTEDTVRSLEISANNFVALTGKVEDLGNTLINATASTFQFVTTWMAGWKGIMTGDDVEIMTGNIGEFNKAMRLTLDNGRAAPKSIRDSIPAIEEVTEAWSKQDQQMLENTATFKIAKDAGGIMLRTLNDGIGDFIDGTKSLSEAFSGMAIGLLQDLAKMIIQYTILAGVAAAFNALTGGAAASGMGFAGGLAKSFGMDSFLPKAPYQGMNPGMATGGAVSAGQSYMVGESGRELFTPDVGGTITPNNELGGGVVINNKIEIINQSGSPLQGSVTSEQQGDATVTQVILKDLRGSGAISRGIQQRFNLASSPR